MAYKMDSDDRTSLAMKPYRIASPVRSDNDSGTASLVPSDDENGMPEIPTLDESHSKAAQLRILKGVKRKLNELDGDEGEADGNESGKKLGDELNYSGNESRSDGGEESNENQDQMRAKSMMKTEDILLDRLQRRDRARTSKHQIPPTDIIKLAMLQHAEGKPYRTSLGELPKEKPTAEQIDKLQRSMRMAPNYLCRTSSLTPGKRFHHENPTNGLTTKRMMMPAADLDLSFVIHDDIFDLNVGELIYVVAQHLIWMDLNCDELLSWSISTLFNVMHGLNRYNEGQGGTTILYVDTRRTKTRKGENANFIHALRLYEEFKVPMFHGWTQPIQSGLKSRKFTQEYLSHGTIINDDRRFVQAKIATLVQSGLYDIFPDLRIPQGQKRTGLYGGLVLYRTIGYPPNEAAKARKEIYSYEDCVREVPFTKEYLEKVRKITLSFMAKKQGGVQATQATQEPHLHIFLSFLTFYKRKSRDHVLIEWIQAHYTNEDLIDIYDDGAGEPIIEFTHVASNLPEVMQYFDLLRDAAWALGLPGIPDTVVETQNALTGEVYVEADSKLQKHEVKSRVYEKKPKVEKKNELQKSIAEISGDHESDAGDGDEPENGDRQVGNGSQGQEGEAEETGRSLFKDWYND